MFFAENLLTFEVLLLFLGVVNFPQGIFWGRSIVTVVWLLNIVELYSIN